MDNRPVGVFDSGVGGLTAVRELHRLMPGEDIVYFGDTGRVPYGTRSGATIRKYAAQDIKYLSSFGVKAIVIACGTVSSNITAKELAPLIPCTGVVMPSVRAAAVLSQSGKIGVMATSATIRSGAYSAALHILRPGAEMTGNAAPLLVPLVENGLTAFDNPITRLTLEMYLEPFIRKKVDTLILGCTHYPILADIISDILGNDVQLVDSGAEAAGEIKTLLSTKGLLSDREKGKTVYRVTDAVENFVSVARNFLFEDIENSTEFVDMDIISAL